MGDKNILSTELYVTEKVQEPSLALCLALAKWEAGHTGFKEDIPVNTKGNNIMTVELFQVSNSILIRKFLEGKNPPKWVLFFVS